MLDSVSQNAVLCQLSAIRLQIAEADMALIEQRITEEEYQRLLQAVNKELDKVETLLNGGTANV